MKWSLVALAALLAACRGSGGGTHEAPAAPADYAARRAELVRERDALAAAWRAAPSEAARAEVRGRAARALVDGLRDEILPAWNGTPWAFSGTATAPGEAPIACGYFVSTALEHAGLAVERRRLAQQAAEHIITTLVPEPRIARFRRVPLAAFVSAVARQGDGLYIVGLDNHVGFLVVERGDVYFHHASSHAGAVVRERALVSAPLAASSYRVVGKLGGAQLVDAWLAARALPTRVPTGT